MLSTSKLFFNPSTGGATDPYFKYVPLLLETTSTNGQQNNTFLDSSTNNFTITRNGTPTQGSVTPYWPDGYWSNYFNGSTDSLTLTINAAFGFGTGDLTIEFWVYALNAASGSIQNLIDLRPADGPVPITVAINTTGYIYAYNGTFYTSSVALVNSTWNHVALVRYGSGTNNCKLYLNGTQVAQFTDANNWGASSQVTIAKLVNISSQYFNGYISNLRIVKGTAVYTSNFTPSTTPLTAITNTSLLTCQSNRFKDNSTNNFAITTNGTPQVQAFQPFSPPASYTTAAYGGSGYFNGSTDYFTIADSTAFNLSGGSYTIEGWINPNGNYSNYRTLVAKRVDGSGSAAWEVYLNITTGVLSFYNGTNYTSAVVPTANVWSYFAAVYDGANINLYLNGARVLQSATTNTNISATVKIGSFPPSENFWGYLSDLRITKGAALYSGTTMTIPTAPLTTTVSSGTVSLLLNFTNAGIYDAAAQNNEITVGSAQASTTVYKWSPTSMKFNGTTDYLTTIDGPQLQLGSGDFTIEGWVYLSATGVAYGIISKGTASTGWSVNVTSGNKLQFSYTASNLTGATSLAATTWYYFAVVRSGSATGNLKVYLNGSVDATSGGAVTDSFTQTNTLYVGADRVGTSLLSGYLQDVRLTKGYARTITTPTAAFPTR